MADLSVEAGTRDIEHGLGLLASLMSMMQDNDGSCPAQVALAQKAGALIERGAVSCGLMPWPQIVGNVEDWLGIASPKIDDGSAA